MTTRRRALHAKAWGPWAGLGGLMPTIGATQIWTFLSMSALVHLTLDIFETAKCEFSVRTSDQSQIVLNSSLRIFHPCRGYGRVPAPARRCARLTARAVSAVLGWVALVSFTAPGQAQTMLLSNYANRHASARVPAQFGEVLRGESRRQDVSPRVSVYSRDSNGVPGSELYLLSGTVSAGKVTLTSPPNAVYRMYGLSAVFTVGTNTPPTASDASVTTNKDSTVVQSTEQGLHRWHVRSRLVGDSIHEPASGSSNWDSDFHSREIQFSQTIPRVGAAGRMSETSWDVHVSG